MNKSLEQIEKQIYRARPSILELPVNNHAVVVTDTNIGTPDPGFSLDGQWELVEGGHADRINARDWPGSISAQVPGSIHNALISAGVIPDPAYGKNDVLAREKSTKTWWLRKIFSRPAGYEQARLVFGGVCESCTVWLNGQLLGSHKGMFGGPDFLVSDLLQDENILVVKINPAPFRLRGDSNDLNDFFNNMNIGWTNTAVFNCVYGWHYANIPSLGIWQSVRLLSIPDIEIVDPFITTLQADKGSMRATVRLSGPVGGFEGRLTLQIKPENFIGESCQYDVEINSPTAEYDARFDFIVPDCHLWWPNGIGEQNLYQAVFSYADQKGVRHSKQFLTGVRTIEMKATGGEPSEKRYNWTFVINGQPIFIKGANWCTIDYLMDFTRERYNRFLTLAQRQHIQLLRAWGGGMPETDIFYEWCDRKGIMVMQEWPTAWDSQKVQDPDVLRETVIRNTRRIRNHPSLAIWTGGNESADPTDAVMDMIGRLTYENDGTRVFHRNDPWGGSSHNYDVYWGRKDLEYNLAYTAEFIGEFGFASSPNRESARRYLSAQDFTTWPPKKGGNVEHHTPVFNQKGDMDILNRYITDFLPNDSLENFITSTQLCQTVALRHTLELARTRWPQATGALYYKMTDVFPAISWSSVDYYGVPKMAYYFVQDSFTPLHACVLFTTLNPRGKPQELPIYLLDDANQLKNHDWTVVARAYDAQLQERCRQSFFGHGPIEKSRQLGNLTLDETIAACSPLFVVVEIQFENQVIDRTFYWLNYQDKPGCLFELPRARLTTIRRGQQIHVKNISTVPAVGAHFDCPAAADRIELEDNFFWLDAGEQRDIEINLDLDPDILAWNADLSENEG